jgi:hypothetical protein
VKTLISQTSMENFAGLGFTVVKIKKTNGCSFISG